MSTSPVSVHSNSDPRLTTRNMLVSLLGQSDTLQKCIGVGDKRQGRGRNEQGWGHHRRYVRCQYLRAESDAVDDFAFIGYPFFPAASNSNVRMIMTRRFFDVGLKTNTTEKLRTQPEQPAIPGYLEIHKSKAAWILFVFVRVI